MNRPTQKVRVVIGAFLLSMWLSVEATAPAKPTHSQTSAPCCAVTAPAQPAVPDTRGTSQQPLAVQVTNLPPPPVEPSKTDLSGWVIAGATVVLALVTTALAFFTLRLWQSTGALVRGAEETATRELRAYVAVHDPWIEAVEAHRHPIAHIWVKNYGQTPAYKVRTTVNTGLGADFANMPALDPLPDTALGHLAPGAELQTSWTLPQPLSATDPASLDVGHLTLFCYGEIHYVDAFRKPHWTRFRIMTGGSSGLKVKTTDDLLALVSCSEGNETDDDI